MRRLSGSCARPAATCRSTARFRAVLAARDLPHSRSGDRSYPAADRRLEVDAAILFSDLLLPLAPMGLPFDFIKGEGPQIERPIDGPADIERLQVVRAA